MGHTKMHDLIDLKLELEKIAKLTHVFQKSPGIFYFKSQAFLHFHDEAGARWADVKIKKEWRKIKIDFQATKKERENFLKQIFKAHQKILKTKDPI